MQMTILNVTDLELMTAQTVKLIFIVILISGGLLNLYKAVKTSKQKVRVWRIIAATALFLFSIPVFRLYDIEGNLLKKAKYTPGLTLGYCQAFAKGKAIEFKYEVAGITYRNCNTFHPLSIDSISVPNGKYYVRYSEKYLEKGCMDFNKPVE